MPDLTGEPDVVTSVDVVNHPSHYKIVPDVECIQVTQWFGFCRGNAIKYLWRAGAKAGVDEVQDLRKAIWYIEREIAMIEAQRDPRLGEL